MIVQNFYNVGSKVQLKVCLQSIVKRTLYNNVTKLNDDCSEIELDMLGGKVRGKLWGSQEKQPLLAIHGWQDNAGSFDALAPLLMKNTPILALDIPGHGKSSWLPLGAMYQELLSMFIHRVNQHFGWKKIKLMGHSMGAQMCFWHASLFPEETDFVIALDSLKFESKNFDASFKRLKENVSMIYKVEEFSKMPPLRYTEKEIIQKWVAATNNSVDETACRMLMARGTNKGEDGKYTFTRDPKLKILSLVLINAHEHLFELAQFINCPYLVIKAESSPFFDKKENYYDIISIMQKNNKDMQYITIPGQHHVHMTNAQSVANIVNPFLKKYNV